LEVRLVVNAASAFASLLVMALLALRIEATQPAPKPGSPEVQQLLEVAKKNAGKVFDNLYVIVQHGHGQLREGAAGPAQGSVG
jgi:hypothetical protein